MSLVILSSSWNRPNKIKNCLKEIFRNWNQKHKQGTRKIFLIRMMLTKMKRWYYNSKKKLLLFRERLSKLSSLMIKRFANWNRKDKRMSNLLLIWRNNSSILSMNSKRLKFWLKSKRMNLNSFNLNKRSSSQPHMPSEWTCLKITLKNQTKRLTRWSRN